MHKSFLYLGMGLAVSLLSLSCANLGDRPSTQKRAEGPILIIGHRGACGYLPEHTQASYELAMAQGADFIEPDLVVSKDGVLVVRHENELSETTDVAKKFPKRKVTKSIDGKKITGWFAEDFTLAELKTLRAKERLPQRDHKHDFEFPLLTFQEVLMIAEKGSRIHHRTIGIYPETKHPSYFRGIGHPLEPLLIDELKRHGLVNADSAVIVQSAELSSLKKIRETLPIKTVFLMDESSQRPFDHVLLNDPRTYGDLAKPDGLRELAKFLYGIGPWKRLIVPEAPKGKLLPPTTLVTDAHAAGLKVHPYTFRSDQEFLAPEYTSYAEKEYMQFYALGVDGVFSDFADQAVKAREKWLAHRR